MTQKFGLSALGLGLVLLSAACGARNGLELGSFADGSTGVAGLSGAGGRTSSGAGGYSGFGGYGGYGGYGAGGLASGGSGFAGAAGFGALGGLGGFAGAAGVAGMGGAGGGQFSCSDCFAMDLGPCVEVGCDARQQECSIAPVADGTSCDDADFCTLSTVCSDGVCGAGVPNTCGLTASGCESVACDSDTESCSLEDANEGMTCTASDACVVSATCQSGVCSGSPKDCSSTPLPGQCYVASCASDSGDCVVTAVSDIACDDGDPCTSDDSCSQGTCTPGTAVVACSSGDQCCPSGCDSDSDGDCPPDEIVLDDVNRGWWNSNGSHTSSNDNTLTAYYSGAIYNSYFTFDLSSVQGTVTSVTLVLELEHFWGTDSSETVVVYDVSTAAATLEGDGSGKTAIYDDLQSGHAYGSYTAVPGEQGALLTITLDSQAVADVNAALGGSFSIGLHIGTLTQSSSAEGLRFSYLSEERVDQLVLGF